MAFGDTYQERNTNSGERSSTLPYLKLEQNEETIIRILGDEVSYWEYWFPVNLSGSRVDRPITVGLHNPIRTYMDSIGSDNEAYRKPRQRFAVNVLWRKPSLSPSGMPIRDAEGEVISEDVVKILMFGPMLMKDLKGLRMRHPITFQPLTVYDTELSLVANGEGKNQRITTQQAMVYGCKPLPDSLLTLPRYDLRRMFQPMPNEAVEQLMAGEDYNEVRKQLGFNGDYPMIHPEPF